jgi:CelD/BcsL family acetyltransferase involved in cellulose biosynthesis
LAAESAHVHRGIASLAPEWEELADRLGAAPFARPGWFEAYAHGFEPSPLDVFAVRRRHELVALLPLVRRRGALASPTNWHTPEFEPLALDGEAARALARSAMGTRARRVQVGFVDARSDSVAALAEAARAARRRVVVRVQERSPYVAVEGSFDDYERARLGSKRRSNLRRLRRRLEERGGLAVEVHDGGERLDTLLEEGFRVEAASWKGERGTAISSRPDTRRFYTALARWAAERGWLRLAFLRAAGEAIAFDFSIEHGGRHYLLKTGFDPARRAQAPGLLLRQAMIRRSFELGFESYEFLGDENEWKMEWTDRVRERTLVQAFAPTAAGAVEWAAWAHGRGVVKRVLALRPR